MLFGQFDTFRFVKHIIFYFKKPAKFGQFVEHEAKQYFFGAQILYKNFIAAEKAVSSKL